MSEFDLDLRTIEESIEDSDGPHRIVLDVLDGSTPDREYVEAIEAGQVLVLAVEGDVNERAAGFARDVHAGGGSLVHFRGFLIVAPPGVGVDTDRL
ncbi:DUF5779 family protein [Halococcoides cellulosivorans]|uniref:Uncharacterized protein n=1 Tax=Halococcoides cellulosivorans TaxID=1679096 RepID=A0A2R4X218_9EURY|nr:DUF5779 family protein [Halococcoides cellulosivorans]AWB27847.1 hypothetical protein HARCEL1_09045 [Halococcoides cellulosivorans]